MRVIVTLLLGIVCQIGSAWAEPALWSAQKGEQTVYVFGTLHSVPASIKWRSDTLDAALSDANVIILEAPDHSVSPDVIKSMGVLPVGASLSASLTPDDQYRLAQESKARGLPLTGIDRLRPWLATITLSAKNTETSHVSVDRALATSIASTAYFETPQSQLERLAGLPHSAQYALLSHHLDTAPSWDHDLQAAWLSGDLATLDDLLNADMRKAGLADPLLLEPNREWSRKILAQTAETAFIAVGAGHVIGRESLLDLLEREGYAVSRIQ